jgi:hypothetical protein
MAATFEVELAFGYSPEKLLLYNEMIEDNWIGVESLRTSQYEKAENFYNSMLGRFYEKQSFNNERFHKGTPYHNLALAQAGQGRLRDAMKNFILAFIEDVLSFGEAIVSVLPAEKALTMMNLSSSYLIPIKEKAISYRDENSKPSNPEKIYLEYKKIFETPGLLPLQQEDIVNLISSEETQNMSSIAIIQRIHYDEKHKILETMIANQKEAIDLQFNVVKRSSIVSLSISIVSLILGLISLILGIISISSLH